MPLCKGSETRLWVSSFSLRNGKRISFVYVLFSPVTVSSISPSPPSCLTIIHASVSIFHFTRPLCTCSCVTAAAIYSGLIKHNKQSRSDKYGPQPIVSTLDGVHMFKCNKKACHCDFKCLRQAVITGTDIPLMHFCNGVLFPGWSWTCHSGREHAESLFSCLFTIEYKE